MELRMEPILEEEPEQPKISDPALFLASIRNWSLDDVEIVKPLADGKFGHVFLAREVESGRLVVLKMYFKSELKKAGIKKQLRRDLAKHARLRHPHILRLYGYFHDKHNIYLIMEYADGGTVFDEIAKQSGLNEVRSAMLLVQLVCALLYCQSQDIVVRDLSPESLLFSADEDVKMTGFIMPVSAPSSQRTLIDYRPPELYQGPHFDHRAMLWELGVLLYELLVGRLPFAAENRRASMRKSSIVDFSIPDFVSDDAQNLINKLMQRNPKDRVQLEDILQHPWVTQNVDVQFIVKQSQEQMWQPKLSYDTSLDDSRLLETIDELESTLDTNIDDVNDPESNESEEQDFFPM